MSVTAVTAVTGGMETRREATPAGTLPPEVYDRLRHFKGEAKRQKDLRKAAELAAESEIADLKEQLRAFDAMFLTYYVTPMGSRTRKLVRGTIQARLGIADHAFMAWEVKTAADITRRNPGGV